MNIRLIVFLAVAGFIGVQSFRFQNRTKKLTQAEAALSDSSRALSKVRSDNRLLKGEVNDLSLSLATMGRDKAELGSKYDRANAVALSASIRLNETNQTLRTTSQALSAARAKQAADVNAGGIGAVSTTEADSVTNRAIATLKAVITNYETNVIPGLQRALAQAQEEKSDLENALNESGSETVAIQRKLADARQFVQQKRAEAKGLFSRKRNKVLGEVDAQLEK